MSEADDQYTKKLEWHIDTLIAKCERIENENIALATANSELRSEVLARGQLWQASIDERTRIKDAVRQVAQSGYVEDIAEGLDYLIRTWND
jgi:hypothetical protein